MFRIGKVAWLSSGGFAPYMDAPDAGAGGGAADPAEGGDGLPPSDADPGAGDEPPATTDDEEDDEDPDLRADAEVTPERFKRVTAKLAKLNRRDKSFRVERARLKELREQGITLDDLIHGTRQHRELAEQIANNPTLRKLVHGDTAAEERAAPAREPEDPAFDESSLPFDPNENPTHRYFADVAKANHELRQTAKKLEARLNQIEGKDTQRQELAERATWKSAIDAAAATIEDEDFRTVFKDAMTAAYQNRTAHKRSPGQIIAHYLKSRMTRRQAATATDAAARAAAKATTVPPKRTDATQQRIAEANRNLPRTVAPNGTPAPARNKVPTMGELRKRIAATGR